MTATTSQPSTLGSYYAMTMPGLETIAYSEIKTRMPDAELLKFARGVVLFRTGAAVRDLLKLRITEDVFVLLRHITHLGRAKDALRVLHGATLQLDLPQSLALWQAAQRAPSP